MFFACPAQGEAKVCVNDKIIGDCKDGQIATGECSVYAAYCSTKIGNKARCVSVFCAAPDEFGQITFDPCPAGETCTDSPTVHCE